MMPPFGPAATAPITAPAPPARIKHGAYMICVLCHLAEDYCVCAQQSADAPSGDATAENNLAKRITEARQNAGGR